MRWRSGAASWLTAPVDAVLRQWQREAERAASTATLRLGPHSATMLRDETVREIESQAVALDLSRRRRPITAPEDLREVRRIETNALVAHAHRRVFLVGRQRHRDGRSLRRILHGVREKIHEH